MQTLYVSRPLSPAKSFTDGIEGPACDSEGIIYAVNCGKQGTIGAVSPAGDARIFIELPDGSIGNGIRFRSDGTMLIADYSGHNILQVDMLSHACTVFAHDPGMHQPNDICLMKNGILFASDPHWQDCTGQIWRCGLDGKLICLERDMGTTNGIEVSHDEKTLYVNESVQRRIWEYDLSPSGELSNKRLLIEFPDHGLDGMRCDVDGNIYVTRYGKGTIAKLDPQGKLLLEIKLHGTRPSNVAFGGKDGCTLYVTEVDHGRIEEIRVEREGREWGKLSDSRKGAKG